MKKQSSPDLNGIDASHINHQNSPIKMILSLAWPQVLMMFFHFWIGFLDVYVAGLIDSKVQASLGIVTQILFFLLIVAISFANGSVTTISQSLGARRENRAKKYGVLCLEIALVAGLILCLTGLFFKKGLVLALKTPEALYDITIYFIEVYVLLIPIYYQFIATNAILRAQKQVYIPLISMMLVTTLNGILNFSLCFGYWIFPNMGFKGLPWATFFSVLTGFVVNLLYLTKKGWLNYRYIPSLKWIKYFFPYLWKVSWPIGLNQILWHFAYVILFSITATLPDKNIVALAAFTAGSRIEAILFLPAFAFNMTASILVGHYLGTGDYNGAKNIGNKTWMLGISIISFMAIILWFLVQEVSGLLSDDTLVQMEIINYLKYNILAIPFTVSTMIFGGVFMGAGATKFNMICVGGSVWLIRVPFAYILGHIILKDPTGIWIAMFLSQMTQSIIMGFLFIKDKWKGYTMKKEKSILRANVSSI